MKTISNYNSWEDLNKYLTSLTTSDQTKLAGNIFEYVCKYYLQTAPHYKSKLKNIWLLKEVNEKIKNKLNLPDSDEGIDLIAETKDHNYWAIQAKYRSNPKSVLTVKGDLSTFANLAFNHCNNISHGLVLTTSDKPPLKSKYLKNVGFETVETFLNLDDNNYEGWKRIKSKAEGKIFIPKAKLPRQHQIEAIEKSLKYFSDSDRGKIIMPCGTGKSLASFWIARKIKAKSIIIAVPSLSLLQQTLKVWTREFLVEGIEPDWLCVCSDKTVSDDLDDFVTNTSEMGFEITTDKDVIKNWLKKEGKSIKIIFTTYQSSKVTIEGSKDFTFDFAILDEAHKTVGHEDKPKAQIISQKKIKIKKRLFMTATERLFRKNKNREEYLSMDDINTYGKIIYQLSFKRAIESEPQIISDYKVITFGVSSPDIEAIFNSNKFIQLKKEIDDNITAREFATAIALRKAMKQYEISNAISFHRSISRAKNFQKQQDYISKAYNEYGGIKSFHVSGQMPTNLRANQMRSFSKSKKALMTNARCLTEGVDLPAIDCVVFTDPKRSKIDIVQAAGRALRLSPGKKFGYILIPILIPEGQDPELVSRDSAFEEIVSVIGSLSTQDSRIAEYLRAVTEGKIPQRGSPIDGTINVNILTKVNAEEFIKAIQIKIWDKIARVNFRTYKECKKYARSLNLKSIVEWNNYKKIPQDIPRGSEKYFRKTKEWEGWPAFLGYERFDEKTYSSYAECKKYAQSLKLKNSIEWNTWKLKIPTNIPKVPQIYFKEEWEGWGEFLGTGNKPTKKLHRTNWKDYEEAKVYAKQFNFIRKSQWKEIINKLPNDIPRQPDEVYRNEWEGWPAFLGYGIKRVRGVNDSSFDPNLIKKGLKGAWRSYAECKKYAQSLKLKTSFEWNNWKLKIPADIPRSPSRIFKEEWESWGEFLGTGNKPKDLILKKKIKK